jgi:hypothetical protein
LLRSSIPAVNLNSPFRVAGSVSMDAQQLTVRLEQAALAVLSGQNQEAMGEAAKFMNKAAKQIASIMPLYTLLKHQNPGVRGPIFFFSRACGSRHNRCVSWRQSFCER